MITFDPGEISRTFRRLATPVDNPGSLLSDVGAASQRFVDATFARGADPFGTPWRPLASGSGRRPLVLTGLLRARARQYRVFGDRVVFGDRNPFYAEFHQRGTARIPRRRFYPEHRLPDAWLQALSPIVRRHLLAASTGSLA